MGLEAPVAELGHAEAAAELGFAFTQCLLSPVRIGHVLESAGDADQAAGGVEGLLGALADVALAALRMVDAVFLLMNRTLVAQEPQEPRACHLAVVGMGDRVPEIAAACGH